MILPIPTWWSNRPCQTCNEMDVDKNMNVIETELLSKLSFLGKFDFIC